MPLLARSFIKAGFVYLLAALVVNGLAAGQAFGLPPALAALSPVYTHLLMLGWVTQIIMGVAYWMFPKQSKATPRGSPALGWWTFALLNAGLIMRAVGEPLRVWLPEAPAGGLLALSALVHVAAAWLFIANTWARVKER
jgi:hypothetical protein